ncbi:MAG: CotH kinase family protein [Muribaculaceae bacterium]|nr:CotH kinase family protein [Muribaculaceae bacterium]
MKRIVNALFLLALSFASLTATAQISLDSRRAVHDSLTGNWLCCVPQSAFDNDFTAIFNCDSAWTDISIDGIPVALGTAFTFNQVSGSRNYHLKANESGKTIEGDIQFTFYPILEFNGDFSNNYQYTQVVVNMPDQAGPQVMPAKLKWRGGSTNAAGRHKRNYHIKFVTADSVKQDRSFFGLRNDNSWILDAGQIDLSRIRNRVSTELWLDIGAKPYYADKEPKALTGVRGDMVEVVLNGNYAGVYALTEALDRKQMKLKKYDETTGTFRGMLWKAVASDGNTRMRSIYYYNNNRDSWGGYEVKYPDPDDVLPTDYSTLYNAIYFVVNSDNKEFRAHVEDYFDVPVLIDYWVFLNTLMGIDNGVKNIYWACYDQTQDKKLTLAAWDLDCTVGQNWINTEAAKAQVTPTTGFSVFNRLFQRLYDTNAADFCTRSVARYQELRAGLLSGDSLKARYGDRIRQMIRTGAAARETKRWSRDTDISRQVLDFEKEIDYINDWIGQRLPFLDKGRFLPYIMGDANRDGVVDVADVNKIIKNFLIADYPMWYEDLNGDDEQDVSDINLLINIVLSK